MVTWVDLGIVQERVQKIPAVFGHEGGQQSSVSVGAPQAQYKWLQRKAIAFKVADLRSHGDKVRSYFSLSPGLMATKEALSQMAPNRPSTEL